MNLYEFAQETERSGVEFYQDLADRAAAAGIQKVFSLMASDEEKLLDKLSGFKQHYPEISEMNCGDLNERSIVFHSICDGGKCDRISSDLDAYQLAIEAKKRIVARYLEAAAGEEEVKTKQMLQWLAAFERHQLREIEQLYDFANAPNHSLEWGEFSNLDEFHNFGYYEDLRRGDLDF